MPSLLRGPLGRSLRSAERRVLDWLFQFLFVYDCHGQEHVPATITGAHRAWPYCRELPRPARIRVRFHPPIDPAAYRAMSEHEAIASILVEWRRRVERSLRPGSKADERIGRLWVTPAARPR